MIITSKNNIKIKELLKLKNKSKYRKDLFNFVIEGERIIKDTPIDLIVNIFVSNSYKGVIPDIDSSKIFYVDDKILKMISDTKNYQGIIAIVKFFNSKIDITNLDKNYKYNIAILDGIQDPGNLGTIIRTAEASGIDLLILSEDCCDLYSPKVIRATMSSIFRVNIYISNNLLKDIDILKKQGIKIYATSLNAKYDYVNINTKESFAIIYGNEGNGIKKEILDNSNQFIIIKQKGNIDSLNVSIAFAIISFDILRKNNFE